ncbi:MAG: peptide ABC transporter substrate-binding protein [Oscillospiraceae bacterium]|nr:peptide ABC transporter substrate-binding protein [Oscillospiraceae bacterium]
MKKAVSLLLALVMLLALAACGGKNDAGNNSTPSGGDNVTEGPHGIKYAEDQTLHVVYSTEAETLHPYTGGGGAGTWQAISNLCEGLTTVDQYGNFIPGLAESYTVSDDDLVYTYKIRQGVHWVDWEGNEKDELTAQDFVTAAQFICNPDNASGSASYYQDIVEGATALLAGETTDMDTLGVKALDDHTLEITLAKPVPYFYGYGGHIIPVPTSYFNELGTSYGMDQESLYYIGPYRLIEFEPQMSRVYVKNDSYWDADNVHILRVEMTYNAEASTLSPELFKRGEVDSTTIGADIVTEWMTADDTKNITLPPQPDPTYTYYYGFCYTPNFDAEYEPENWAKAIDNENFRQSLYWGLDRVKARMATMPYNTEDFLITTITPVQWCPIDGTDYTELDPIAEITHRANFSFDEAKALEYKEKAVEELTAEGVTFPIKVYMPYNPNSSGWDQEIMVVKQQLTDLFGSDYLDIIIEAGPSTGFLADVRRTGKYGFMKLNNGAADYDPQAWTVAFSEGNSWTFLDQAVGPNVQALAKEYLELLNKAKAITSLSVERYQAFAEAEKFLLEHALVIPFTSDSTGYVATKINPFEEMHNSDGGWKYARVLAEPMTVEQYDACYTDWLAAREASRK